MVLRKAMFPGIASEFAGRTPAEHEESNGAVYSLKKRGRGRTRSLDPSSILFNDKSQEYEIMSNGLPIYLDNNHLTPRGVQMAFRRILGQALAKVEQSTRDERGANSPQH
jgi:hypothetical protein